jgi:hypothetical protein
MGNIDGSSVVRGLCWTRLTGCLGGLFRPSVLVPLSCGDVLPVCHLNYKTRERTRLQGSRFSMFAQLYDKSVYMAVLGA